MQRHVYRSAFAIAASLGVGLTVQQVSAQTTDTALQEIIVTARRVEERLQDVPISITVLNQRELTNRNIVTAGDLGAFVPSLATNERFGSESTSFAIRGFTQEAQTAPSVAVYFADVTAPRAQGGTTAGNGAGVGSFFDLQNVQVLRGPQGTLFGRNTTGGAVLLVPQKPTDNFEGYAEASAGNYDMRRMQAVMNAPMGDSVRFRIGVDTQERDGYLENKSGIGPRDFNDVDYLAVRASLVVDLSENLENYTIASWSKSETNGFYPKVVLCNATPNSFSQQILAPLGCAQIARQNARGDDYYDVENGNRFAGQEINQRQIINTTTWSASDAITVKNIASYAEFKQAQSANIFGDNFALGPGVPFTYVSLNVDAGRDNTSQWTFTEELQLQGRTDDSSFVWQTGVYFEKSGPLDGEQGTLTPILLSCTNVYALQCFDPIGAMAGVPVGTITQSLTEYEFRDLGIYAQGTYRFTDTLSLTAGVRYTSDRTEGTGKVRAVLFPAPNTPFYVCANSGAPAPTPDACTTTFVDKSEEPTWVLDLEYKLLDDLMVYGKYSRGYRQGGVNTSNSGFETWEAEQVDTFEIGAKSSFDGPVRGYFNLAAFYNDFSDQQLQANAVVIPPQSPIAPIVNAGKSRIQGVEIDASITPFEGMRLDLAYAYLDTELRSFTAPPFDRTRFVSLLPTAVVGGELTLSPENRVTATATYTLPLPQQVGDVSIGATFTHTDEQLASTGSPIGRLPATDLVNVNLNWAAIGGLPLDVALFATNVTDKEYATYVGGSYQAAGFESLTLGAPRMYGARVRYSFGM